MALKTVGIFGGTFNTFHAGHRRVVELALNFSAPKLDLLLVVPARNPYLRDKAALQPYSVRCQQVADSLRGMERVQVADLDDETQPSYSVELVRVVKAKYGVETKVILVVGSDLLPELHRWHQIGELATQATFWVAGRGALSRGSLSESVDASVRGQLNMTYIGDTGTEVSSSALREAKV